MSKLVIVSHAHHKDEGVYRLVFAEEVEHVRYTEAENPDFDPEAEISEGNRPMVVQEEPFLVHVNHQDVVWAADDKRWKGKSKEQVAQAQRRVVRDMITQRIAEADRAEAKRKAASTDLGGVGTEL